MADLTPSRSTALSRSFPSVLASVGEIELLAETRARDAGFDPDTASQIAMVCREAAINAIFHGNRQDPAKPVQATFALTGEAFSIQIADSGTGVDPAGLPDPLAPENLLRSSGRGIFLMRALMDEVHFRQLTPGTEITLIKRLHPAG